jgi:hypothetical protein
MICPKERFYSRGQVDEALAASQAMRALDPRRREQRAYCCWGCWQRARCGVWHLTREELTGASPRRTA